MILSWVNVGNSVLLSMHADHACDTSGRLRWLNIKRSAACRFALLYFFEKKKILLMISFFFSIRKLTIYISTKLTNLTNSWQLPSVHRYELVGARAAPPTSSSDVASIPRL